MYDLKTAPSQSILRLTDMIRVLNPSEHHVLEDREITGFCTDSRNLKPGEVYVAIAGQRVDGHRFVENVQAADAGACLVSSWDHIADRNGCVLVSDTVAALGFLAACHRASLNTKVIGLTGSVGKTTTKEILTTLLASIYRTRKSEGNFNSTIGLPVQLLRLREGDQWMVAEMGMSTPGEIEKLTLMAKPDIGLWTSVEAVHLANFENIEGIAEAKAELVQNMAANKTLVYNMDDPLVSRFCGAFPGKKVGYALFDPDAEVRARIEPFPDWNGTHFDLWINDSSKLSLHLPMVGRFNVYNAIAACAAATVAGVPSSELKYSLKGIHALSGRSGLHEYSGDTLLVDDTYNANPHAVDQVLRSFATLAPGTWRWILLGDMLELGPDEEQIHAELGRQLAGYGFDRVTLVGPLSAHTHRALSDASPEGCHIEHFADAIQAAENLVLEVPDRARIWAKASRGIQLEQVTRVLCDHLNQNKGI